MTLLKAFDLRKYAVEFQTLLIGIALIGSVLLVMYVYHSNCDLAAEMGFGNAMHGMGLCYV